MELADIISAAGTPPRPWLEGRTIPWDNPDFSRRMLQQHLSQEHDRASRRFELIDRHIDFIRRTGLQASDGNVVDLGCGPGFYVHRLAAAGYRCLGVDFSPASIEFAREQASQLGLDCCFELADIRQADLGRDIDLVMLLYGELNLFPREEAIAQLTRCRQALSPGGRLLLEVHSFEKVQRTGEAGARWSAVPSGLFSDRPHLRLDEAFWLTDERCAVGRYWVVEAATSEVSKFGWTMQGYVEQEYETLLREAGLAVHAWYPSLTGEEDGAGFPVMVASAIQS